MDLLDVKKDFPLFDHNDIVYLDTAATALTPKNVVNALCAYYNESSANVHRGVYKLSHEATNRYNETRQAVADFIGADFDEIVFTRGASSALNLVAFGYGLANLQEGDEIVVSELEHHSNFLPWQQVAKKTGAKLVYVPLSETGRIEVEAFESVVNANTKIVALTHVSNVMGYITPIREITKIAHKHGAVVSVDAAQSAPHIAIDVREIDCDFLAFSSHKMLGPKGLGVLYGKKKRLYEMEPVEYGGDMVETAGKEGSTWQAPPIRFETGTPPIDGVIAFSEALKYLKTLGFDAIAKHEKRLKDYVLKAFSKIEGVTVYNPTSDTGMLTFNLESVHPHDVVTVLDEDNIAVRAGHHCAQPLMQWLNVPATLRASFYIYNTLEDCDRLIESVKKASRFFRDAGL